MMRGHHDTQQEDDQCWHDVQRCGICSWLFSDLLRILRVRLASDWHHVNVRIQPFAKSLRFDEHTGLRTKLVLSSIVDRVDLPVHLQRT